ncbi:signal peptidase II [Lentzea alba]|uniref:signal peptidase II n=1 Tax=Lentzea alba TaxID=2714351 RepID=UPI0039BFA31D
MSDESKAAQKAAEPPASEQVSKPAPVGEPDAATEDTDWADRASDEVAGIAPVADKSVTEKGVTEKGVAEKSEAEKSAVDKSASEEQAKPEVKDESAVAVDSDDVVEPEFSITGSLPEPKIKILAVLAGVVLALDVLTKVLSVAFLEDAEPIQLFGGVLYLTFVRNPGAAFGMAEGMTWILALIALGVVGFILWISRNLRSQPWAVGLGLVLGGAVGNLVDRLFREPGPMRGHVVDFLSLFDPFGRVWPVFNVADMAIVCGGATIVVLALRQHDYDGTVNREAKTPAEPSGLQEPQ